MHLLLIPSARPPLASAGQRLRNGSFCPCLCPWVSASSPPSAPAPLGTRRRKPSLETKLQSGCGKRGPLLGNNFQRILRSRVSMGTRVVAQGTPPSQPTQRDLGKGRGAALPGTATAFWPPALTNLKSSYSQICLFFLHSNLKATPHSKDASGVSRMDFYVVQ